MNDPVAEYKRLLDTAHQAADTHRKHEQRRALELTEHIRDASKAITTASAREADVTREITGWWSNVTRNLTSLVWLDLTPPAPDPGADPRRLNAHLAEVEPATSAFRVALRRALWPRKLP
ncbi:hypothetical protein [Actinokineospora fastidiosa]|uniref:Uncharacterized protein n=1 Tax=Actinokineospora fastidiosa TaxID=1816 RepID=A0A918LD61_9PSEU|nr:hypothetical protein [Actinokineospora fastidiosa]GGS31978.1 hypothetical protein GCM10010171_27380 [Actinokineospora fastidiosa]